MTKYVSEIELPSPIRRKQNRGHTLFRGILSKSCVFQRAEGALFARKFMHLGILRGMLIIPIDIRAGDDGFWDLFGILGNSGTCHLDAQAKARFRAFFDIPGV